MQKCTFVHVIQNKLSWQLIYALSYIRVLKKNSKECTCIILREYNSKK